MKSRLLRLASLWLLTVTAGAQFLVNGADGRPHTVTITGPITATSTGVLAVSGAITPTTINGGTLSGSAGGGFVANGVVLTVSGSSSFTLGAAASGQSYTFPSASDTVLTKTTSASGAASAPVIHVTGVPFAGTGTTSFPLVYINDANATASTTLNTAGTYFGVNGDGTQDLLNLLKDGTSQFKVSSSGTATATSVAIGGAALGGNALAVSGTTKLNANAVINWGGSAADNILLGDVSSNGGYPGIWFGSAAAAPSYTNYSFLADNGGGVIIGAATGAGVSLRVNNSNVFQVNAAGGTLTGTLSVSGAVTASSLTASKPVFTDASKVLTSGAYSVPQIVGSGNALAATATNASVATYTTPNDATVHSFSCGGYVNITAISAGTLTVQMSFTVENNAAQTLTYFAMGVTSSGLTTTGFTGFAPMYIRCKDNTAITFKTSFTGVSIVYDAGGTLEALY